MNPMVGDAMAVGRGEVTPELLGVLLEVRGEPAMTTEEIAEVVRLPDPVVGEQLDRLESGGEIKGKTPEFGPKWWCL